MWRPLPKLDHCADVSSVKRPPLSAYLKPVHTSEPAPFEGVAEGAGDDVATFLPNICDYRSAGRKQPPAPVASLPEDRKVPFYGHSEAAGDTDFGTELHAMLNLWGVQGGTEPGATERTETRITKTGRNGVTFTYLPSHLEAARRMSIDEKLATLRYLREKNRKSREFIQGVGGVLADCMQKLGEAYSDRPIEEVACLNGETSNS